MEHLDEPGSHRRLRCQMEPRKLEPSPAEQIHLRNRLGVVGARILNDQGERVPEVPLGHR